MTDGSRPKKASGLESDPRKTVGRSAAIDELVSQIDDYEINVTQYLGDLEPQSFYDSVLYGKLDALACWCKGAEWIDLAKKIEELLPLNGSAIEALSRMRSYVLPEIRCRLETTSSDVISVPNTPRWQLIHPSITEVARPRWDSGRLADAVEASMKAVNVKVKKIYHEATGEEKDGKDLMFKAFSLDNPIVQLSELSNETGRNIQEGYMHLFAGAMIAIRNPLAHANLSKDECEACHHIYLASLLMHKIDEVG